eukprot:335554-Chlamydomonas_euryale.AAC.3
MAQPGDPQSEGRQACQKATCWCMGNEEKLSHDMFVCCRQCALIDATMLSLLYVIKTRRHEGRAWLLPSWIAA